jgi:hypothetical protein
VGSKKAGRHTRQDNVAAAELFELLWLHKEHHYTDSHCFCNGAQEVKYTIIDLG